MLVRIIIGRSAASAPRGARPWRRLTTATTVAAAAPARLLPSQQQEHSRPWVDPTTCEQTLRTLHKPQDKELALSLVRVSPTTGTVNALLRLAADLNDASWAETIYDEFIRASNVVVPDSTTYTLLIQAQLATANAGLASRYFEQAVACDLVSPDCLEVYLSVCALEGDLAYIDKLYQQSRDLVTRHVNASSLCILLRAAVQNTNADRTKIYFDMALDLLESGRVVGDNRALLAQLRSALSIVADARLSIRLLSQERRAGMRLDQATLDHVVHTCMAGAPALDILALYTEYILSGYTPPAPFLFQTSQALTSLTNPPGDLLEQFLGHTRTSGMMLDKSTLFTLAQRGLQAIPALDDLDSFHRSIAADFPNALGTLSADNVKYILGGSAHPALCELAQSTTLEDGHGNATTVTDLLKGGAFKEASTWWDRVCDSIVDEDMLFNVLLATTNQKTKEFQDNVEVAKDFTSKILHKIINERKLEPKGPLLYCAMMEGFSLLRLPEQIKQLYQLMRARGVQVTPFAFRWYLDALISTFAYTDALEAVDKMIDEDVPLDAFMYDRLLHLFRRLNNTQATRALYRRMIANGITPSVHSVSIMVSSYTNDNDIDGAVKFLGEMTKKDSLVSQDLWPVLISLMSAQGRTGNVDAAMVIFNKAIESGMHPSLRAYLTLVDQLVDSKQNRVAVQMFDAIITKFPKLDVHALNCYLHLLKNVRAEMGLALSAFEVSTGWKRPSKFQMDVETRDKFGKRTKVLQTSAPPRERAPSWPTASVRYTYWRQVAYVIAIFYSCINSHNQTDIQPDALTYGYMFSMCHSLADATTRLDLVTFLWNDMISRGIKPNRTVYTFKMEHLGRNGFTEEAWELYQQLLREQHIPSRWTVQALLTIFGRHGQYNRVETLIDHLVRYRIRPTDDTYDILTRHCNMDPIAVASHFAKLNEEISKGFRTSTDRGRWPFRRSTRQQDPTRVMELSERVFNRLIQHYGPDGDTEAQA